ncbi:MAG: hypothetical protein OXC19_00370 [Bryobacterales bacterium]|nr:hypothetical protein [Bryobacterales bacterium]
MIRKQMSWNGIRIYKRRSCAFDPDSLQQLQGASPLRAQLRVENEFGLLRPLQARGPADGARGVHQILQQRPEAVQRGSVCGATGSRVRARSASSSSVNSSSRQASRICYST